MANKVFEQNKSSFSKAQDRDVSFLDEDKLGYAGFTQAAVPKTNSLSVDGEGKPMMFPNFDSILFIFHTLLIMGKQIHMVGLSSKHSVIDISSCKAIFCFKA